METIKFIVNLSRVGNWVGVFFYSHGFKQLNLCQPVPLVSLKSNLWEVTKFFFLLFPCDQGVFRVHFISDLVLLQFVYHGLHSSKTGSSIPA